MHRRIHEQFTLGFLAGIEARKDPTYADRALWTQLAIAIKADGGVERVDVRRKSGLQAFDVGAADSVRSAAPFPPPPDAIKSADGTVHLDWQFHRDERACGTFGVDPHLDGIVRDEDERALAEAFAQARARSSKDDGADPRTVAESWFAAYVHGDGAWLAGWSGFPFSEDGEVIARDGATLEKFYAELVAKAIGENAFTDLKVLTPAEMVSAAGKLPVGSDPGMLFATAHVASGSITLMLKKSLRGWRVCGIARPPQ